MKQWMVAGAFAAVMFPFCAAAERTEPCENEGARASPERAEPTVAQQSVSTVRAAVAQREANEQTPRPEQQRRRNGKRLPDAELIGPRGAL